MFSANDVCIARMPSHQNAVDLFESWSSIFPARFGVKTGGIPLFEDWRVSWAIEQLGGVDGRSIFELGPLEAGHTYMLEAAGAASVLAIEGNRNCYLKCLITREVVGLKAATFLLGDFVAFLRANTRTFDIAWCAGVLYHMTDPVELLELIGRAAASVYIWTHYIDEQTLRRTWDNPILAENAVEIDGRRYVYYRRSYGGAQHGSAFCGGLYSGAVWMTRADIMQALDAGGFKTVVIHSDDPDHPNGPAISLVARK